MRTILALFLACCTYAANGQTLVGLGAATCNVAQTVCNVQNDAGDAITFIYDSTKSEVTLVVTTVSADLATSTVTYTGLLQLGPPTTSTSYLTITPFTVGLSPTTSTLSGDVKKTRSGSGKGGWAWHNHWEFHTLAIY